jgi:hypothetical protein
VHGSEVNEFNFDTGVFMENIEQGVQNRYKYEVDQYREIFSEVLKLSRDRGMSPYSACVPLLETLAAIVLCAREGGAQINNSAIIDTMQKLLDIPIHIPLVH